MMKGKIHLQSELGKGAEFTLDLPDILVAGTAESELSSKREKSKINFHSGKILLVDDLEINRKLFCAFLAQFPIEVCEASNGKEALEKLESFTPSVIFLDMRMPEMDGYEVLEHLRSDEKLKNIPVVAVTASALKEDERELKNHCAGFLPKPLRKVDLILELKKFVNYTEEVIQEEPLAQMVDTRSNEKLVFACSKEIEPLIKTLKENPSNVNAMIALGNSMNKLSNLYPIESFLQWHNKLQDACDTYDITGVSELIKDYDTILEELKN